MSPIDVVIVGAGVAGLAPHAARERGPARDPHRGPRPGRRTDSTITWAGHPIELGAEFIHGQPPALWTLIREPIAD